MAGRKAPGGRDKLAVVLTGNAARAASLLGALQTLDEAGLAPSVLVGVSGGAVAAALYACSDSSAAARDALYACAEAASWQELADVDFAAVTDVLSRPHDVPGFVQGDALQAALLATPIGHLGFHQLDLDLHVVACDLNSGREMVFGKVVADEKLPYQAFARDERDFERVNIATACRASCLVPGLCRPLDLDHHCLVDGSLRMRRALAVAAAQKGVKRVLWLHAGLDENDTFSLVTDYSGQSFAAGVWHALTVLGADQFDPHTGDPALAGLAVRYVNLATASVAAAGLSKVQKVYESGRRSLQTLLAAEPCAGGKGLFTAEAAELDKALTGNVGESGEPRWSVTVGRGGQNVLAVVDRLPALQQEFGYEFDEYLNQQGLAKLTPREAEATAEWAAAAAEAQLGRGRLGWFHAQRALYYAWLGLCHGLAVAARAARLDRGWSRLTDRTGAVALTISDTLGRKRDAGDAGA